MDPVHSNMAVNRVVELTHEPCRVLSQSRHGVSEKAEMTTRYFKAFLQDVTESLLDKRFSVHLSNVSMSSNRDRVVELTSAGQ